MSPEQWLGHKADERSDLYALGVILYTISSGTRPYEGDNLQALMQQHLKVVPRPAKEHNSMLSDEFCAVVRKLLAKSPQRRYPNVPEFLRDLERYTRGETPEAMEQFGRMIRCGFCETVNPASEKRCKVCHEPLHSAAVEISLQTRTDEFKCPGCGAINRKGSRACAGCAKGFCSNCKRRIAVLQGFCERCMERARQG
jgi:serine/threonine protein kinase